MTLRLLFIIFSCLLVISVLMYVGTMDTYKQSIEDMVINDVDLFQVEDGTYTGAKKTFLVSADVQVTVKNHEIIDIELDHQHSRGHGAQLIPGRVLESQSLDVNVITGATYSSKIILKAIEYALTGQN